MSKQHGKVDWDDVDVQSSQGGGGIFLRIPSESTVRLRVVSKPYVMYVHWLEDATGAKKKINCALESCPICLSGDENPPSVRYLLLTLSRGEGQEQDSVKVLECGSQILTQLRGYHKDPDWGSLSGYDVKLTRGKKNTNPLYQIKPTSKAALSDNEKKLVKAAVEGENKIDLEKLSGPWSVQQIKDAIKGKKESDVEVTSTGSSSSTTDDDDDDSFFK